MSLVKSLASCLLALMFLHVGNNEGEAIPTHGKVVACYVASWARYRPDDGKFLLKDLQPEYCTHLIYAFAGLNETTWEIESLDKWADLEEGGIGNYKKMTELRENYPGLKISIAIGGWNEGSSKYSALAADPKRRKKFIDSVLAFLKEHDFDGLDLDWEFPGQRGGKPEDKEHFSALVKELHDQFIVRNYILTAAISANKAIISNAYDIRNISIYLDYIHVMAYDYHGSWDLRVLPNAPMYGASLNDASINATIHYLLELKASPKKIVLGLPMYGRTYILITSVPPGGSPIGMTAEDHGFSGPYTREKGIMGYNEICKEMTNKSWIYGWDVVSATPYAVNGQRVISYDDYNSLATKVLYTKDLNLAGVMVWSIDTDDFGGYCGYDYILIKSINKAFVNNLIKPSNEDQANNNEKPPSHASCNPSTVFFVIFSVLILIRF